MKIRNGFVSNSSSSSFIIAYNDRKRSETSKLSILEYILEQWVPISGNSDYEIKAESWEAVIHEIEESFYNEEEKLNLIKNLSKYMYKNLKYFNISIHDTMLLNLLNELEKDKEIEILYRGGY